MNISYQNINCESLGSKIETEELETGHMFLKNNIVRKFMIKELRTFWEKSTQETEI